MQKKRDSEIYYDTGRTDAAAIIIALVLTVLIHLAVFRLVPAEFEKYGGGPDIEELKIEILPPKIDKSFPEFVEANPYANQSEPEPGAAESFMTQRAAEELPDPDSKSRKPYTEGEIPDGQKIVDGTSAPEDELAPHEVMDVLERPLQQQAHPTERGGETSPAQQQEAQRQQEQAEKLRIPEEIIEDMESGEKGGAENSESESESAKAEDKPSNTESEDAFLTVTKRETQDIKNSAIKEGENAAVKGTEKKQEQAEAQKPKEQPKPEEQKTPEELAQDESLPAPKMRPTLSMRIPAGPLADNRTRASERGVVSVDSRFSEFGAYQQRMIEAVSRQWNLIASKYDLATAVGSQVVIEYNLNTKGELTKIEVLFSNSTNTGTGLCEQSILTTAPYGEWTQEMVNTLGTQDQTVRITFHYR